MDLHLNQLRFITLTKSICLYSFIVYHFNKKLFISTYSAYKPICAITIKDFKYALSECCWIFLHTYMYSCF